MEEFFLFPSSSLFLACGLYERGISFFGFSASYRAFILSCLFFDQSWIVAFLAL